MCSVKMVYTSLQGWMHICTELISSAIHCWLMVSYIALETLEMGLDGLQSTSKASSCPSHRGTMYGMKDVRAYGHFELPDRK